MAMSRGLLMMQKRESDNGGLNADETTFSKFLENNLNRMIRNVSTQSLSGFDSKLASIVVSGLDDY